MLQEIMSFVRVASLAATDLVGMSWLAYIEGLEPPM
jgi:hypothetical protein